MSNLSDAGRGSAETWLASIPHHWRVGPLRHFISFSTGWTPPTSDDSAYVGEHAWANISDLGPKWLHATTKHLSDEATAGIKPIGVGDLMFAFKLSVGAVSRAGIPMYTNEAIASFAPSDYLILDYAYYALPFFIPLNANTNIYGARLLNSSLIKAAQVAIPPVAEQARIAAYLDSETAKIDALVSEQEGLVQVLRERRAATATRASTMGLDASDEVVLDDDPLVGLRPARWPVKSLRHWLTSLDARRVPLSSEERGARQGEYPYYGASGVIDHVDAPLFREPLVLVSEDGANLLARSTPIAFSAKGEYWVNNHAHVLRPRSGSVDYWAARIESIDVAPVVSGSAQPKLTADALLALRVAAPEDTDEQCQIADFIAEETAKINALIAEAEGVVAVAKERRSALIAAAVTGQIDVRGEVA